MCWSYRHNSKAFDEEEFDEENDEEDDDAAEFDDMDEAAPASKTQKLTEASVMKGLGAAGAANPQQKIAVKASKAESLAKLSSRIHLGTHQTIELTCCLLCFERR